MTVRLADDGTILLIDHCRAEDATLCFSACLKSASLHRLGAAFATPVIQVSAS